MTDNVLPFTGITSIPEPPETFLEKAKAWGMDRCVVIGFNGDGDLMCGSSFSEAGDMLLMLELTKRQLLDSV